jgi:hypothetical protein
MHVALTCLLTLGAKQATLQRMAHSAARVLTRLSPACGWRSQPVRSHVSEPHHSAESCWQRRAGRAPDTAASRKTKMSRLRTRTKMSLRRRQLRRSQWCVTNPWQSTEALTTSACNGLCPELPAWPSCGAGMQRRCGGPALLLAALVSAVV